MYNYICEGEEGIFNFAVEFRYHCDILKSEGNPVGRIIEYDDVSKGLRLLDEI